MKGWLILRHSLRQVFGNLGGALRVSALLYAVQAVIGLALGASLMSGGGIVPGQGLSSEQVTGTLLGLGVAIVTSLWIAVAWHRYVLLREEGSLLPAFHGGRIFGYLLYTIGYGLILIVAGGLWSLLVGYALGALVGVPGIGAAIMALLVYLPIIVLAFRLTAALPGAALGSGTPFFSGWQATSGQTLDLVALAFLLMLLSVVVTLIGAFVLGPIPGIGLVWQLALGWFQTMLGISILTTLYGHYIEKRDLI